jgi:hypothetical protein
MSTNQHDFIPRPDAAFDHFYRNLTDYVIDNNARWQNERGHIGNWSEIQHAIIP